jgi:ubiquitin carboxyl-terminal hydrolase MINDY-3/4
MPAGFHSDGITERLVLSEVRTEEQLRLMIEANLDVFRSGGGAIVLLTSAIFTRSFERIRQDMDDSRTGLIGGHDYCTQELVNLLRTGAAVSNVFDGVRDLDGLVLRGVARRSRIGLLSLFEFYKSIEVGANMKRPVFPIWVVCCESHFTTIAMRDAQDAERWSDRRCFDLVYYDPLARQDYEIRLTVDTARKAKPARGGLESPLVQCLWTLWADADVDWNGVEPLL